MKYIFIFIIYLFAIRVVKGREFRCDYTYVRSVDGWLKYHDIPADWHEARLRCHLEGTTLASPLTYELQDAIQRVSKQQGSLATDIFIGIHSTFSRGDYFSIEGVPLSQIPITWGPGEPDNYRNKESCLNLNADGTVGDIDCEETRPYVCYKKNDHNRFLNPCGTIDDEYVFYNRTGSCYKFHRVPRIYSRAVMTCAAEGGYLAIINSNEEAAIIKSIFAKNPSNTMLGPFYKDVAYLGFSDWGEHGEWLTSHGETLHKAGYARWSPGEPNNSSAEFCGAVYRTGLLLDLKCETIHAFICEKSPNSLICDY